MIFIYNESPEGLSRKRKKRMKTLRSVFTASTVVLFVWLLSETALASQEQFELKSRGFSVAKQLEGRWVREDGGYSLVLADIKSDGSLKAFYFNPRQINVHEANWKFEDERLHLYVELRDVNYPGSNYTLIYRASKDVLWGSYYLAVQKKTMYVSFVRK
jgi:hypothetical protein